jgi:hypothetical protein
MVPPARPFVKNLAVRFDQADALLARQSCLTSMGVGGGLGVRELSDSS